MDLKLAIQIFIILLKELEFSTSTVTDIEDATLISLKLFRVIVLSFHFLHTVFVLFGLF